MAKRMKRTLSLLLTAVLLLGMLPITAAAAESSNQQIEGGNVPVYYTYNEGTGTFAQDANPTNAVTTNKATDPEVTISKVIQGTGTENQFDITLNVTTTQKVERSPLHAGCGGGAGHRQVYLDVLLRELREEREPSRSLRTERRV